MVYTEKNLNSTVPSHIFHSMSLPGYQMFSQASFLQNNIREIAKVERAMARTLRGLEKLPYENKKMDKV